MANDHPNPRFDIRVAYVYSDLPSYVRAKKSLKVLKGLARDVHFIGCHRRSAWDQDRPEGIEYHISDIQLGQGFASLFGVIRFFQYIRRTLQQIKPDVVVVVNEEYALPFAFGYFPRPQRLVIDLYDSIAMRILGRARLLQPLWRLLSSLAMRTSDGLVEVIENRLAWHRRVPPATTVVYNSPEWMDNIEPLEGLPETFIYVSGTHSDHIHGMEPLYAALERVPEMHVVLTGKPLGHFVRNTFLKHPRVHNLGTVPYEHIFRIVKASRAVFAHYNPVRMNYRYGAPNKLYEAMMVGRPILINEENLASSIPKRLGIGLISPYGDVAALARDLDLLVRGAPSLEEKAGEARTVFREQYAWSEMASERWSQLFRDMGIPEVHG